MKSYSSKMTSIGLKKETADRFRVYSKKIAPTHSEALDLIMDCHQGKRKVLPEKVEPHLRSLEKLIGKNFHFTLTILRKIESTQTRPILAMMQLLFQETPGRSDMLYEKGSSQLSSADPSEIPVPDDSTELRRTCMQYQEYTAELLDKIKLTRSSFGKTELRLMLSQKEFLEVKQKFKNLE